MPLLRLTSGFVLRLFLWYAAFLLLWPAVDDAYAAGLRGAASLVFERFGDDGVVRFAAYQGTKAEFDSEIQLANRAKRSVVAKPYTSKSQGYILLAMLFSLILASPVPWARRGTALLLGFLLVHAWALLAIGLMITESFSTTDAVAIYDFPPAMERTLSYVTFVVADATSTRYVIPTLMWIPLMFRGEDLEEWRSQLVGDLEKAADVPGSPAASPKAFEERR